MLSQDDFFEEKGPEDDGNSESEPWDLLSSASLDHDQATQTIEKDLVMVFFLFFSDPFYLFI